jgi:hypothetical protein
MNINIKVSFRLYHHTFKPLAGLADGVIPIFPSQVKFTAHVAGNALKITQWIPALTAAHAFTDYKSQGQTIEYITTDLGKSGYGNITAFNAYVALSRSWGQNTTWLL